MSAEKMTVEQIEAVKVSVRAVWGEGILNTLYALDQPGMVRDAARYRWLRECKGDVCAGIEDYPYVQWLDTTDLDAAVDKAMCLAGKEKK